MGRDIRKDETILVGSSVAMLQERFRELQRVKLMRKQKDALRRLALSSPVEPYHVQLYDHGHYESASPSSLSLQKRKRDDDEEEYYKSSRRTRTRTMINESPLVMKLWPNASSCSSSSVETWECDESNDVDTSLHL